MIASTQTNHPIADDRLAANTEGVVERACSVLREGGLRVTEPRKAILRTLAQRMKPASIEQIHADLAQSSCDLVTVYRCLAAFQELGLVRRSYFENGTSLYQLQIEGNTAYHVISRDGEVIDEIDRELVRELAKAVSRVEEQLKTRGYTGVSHLVEFFANPPRNLPTGPAAPVAASLNRPNPASSVGSTATTTRA